MDHELFSLNTERILQYAVRLTQGDHQNRPLAARIFEGLSYFHPQPGLCLRSLAQLLEEGEGGVERDLNRRFQILHLAATQMNDQLSIYLVALAHLQGHGTETNELIALAAFERIWNGSGRFRFDAGLMMGRILMDGIGLVTADPSRAIQLFEVIRSNADDDSARVEAASHMGELLREGPPGVEVDPVRAAQVYMDVADLENNAHVLFELAQMYEHGEGLEDPDLVEARRWYEEAAAQGHGPSIERLEQLEN